MSSAAKSQIKTHPVAKAFAAMKYKDFIFNMPKSAISRTLTTLNEALNSYKDYNLALKRARSLQINDIHPDLLFFLYINWADLSRMVGRHDEARVLVSRAKSLLRKNSPSALRAAIHMREQYINKYWVTVDTYDEMIRLMPDQSPFKKYIRYTRAQALVRFGRGLDIEKDLSSYANKSQRHWLQFSDYVYRGYTEKAYKIVPQIESDSNITTNAHSLRQYIIYRFLLELITHTETASLPLIPKFILNRINYHHKYGLRKESTDPKNKTPHWFMCIKNLLKRNVEEALNYARSETAMQEQSLLLAELASQNPRAARRHFTRLNAQGNHSILFHIYQTRLLLLENDKVGAVENFAKALAIMTHYKAEPRLDFELKMACELSPGDLIWLTQEANQLLTGKKSVASTKTSFTKISQQFLEAEPSKNKAVLKLLGQSSAMNDIRKKISRFSAQNILVLIQGETGTGKELVARSLHEKSSRRHEAFLAVNCGAIAESLLESELFGHVKGAFTGAEQSHKGIFEEADSGTVFLDEIGEISPRLQIALLRVLEDGHIRRVGSTKSFKINCRIIAATNVDLSEAKNFRQDLYFRLKRLEINIPPLKSRKKDILPLCEYFLNLNRNSKEAVSMTTKLKKALLKYDWPGNVRELKHEMERMRVMTSDGLHYDVHDLDQKIYSEQTPLKNNLHDTENSQNVLEYLKTNETPLRRLERIKDMFVEHKKLTRSEIMKITGITQSTASRYLKQLRQENVIEKIKPSASPRSHYFILKE